jgi:DNA-binding NtrC family response regulator
MNLPPLRERKEDIAFLADHFLRKYNCKRAAPYVRSISDEALRMLLNYDWPGNVRELENVIERAVVLTDSEVLEPIDLVWHEFAPAVSLCDTCTTSLRLDEVEREHIKRALAIFDSHKVRTAEALGIDRKTLRNKMRRYDLGESRRCS